MRLGVEYAIAHFAHFQRSSLKAEQIREIKKRPPRQRHPGAPAEPIDAADEEGAVEEGPR
jgi:hypothetical protein